MNIERLRKIIKYSEEYNRDINSMVKRFCSDAGIDSDNNVLNIMQIVRASFADKGYIVFEIPFADSEIGALCYKGDGVGYIVINTTLPRVNVNFAVAHEIYHVFFQETEFVSKVEYFNDSYYEHEEEYAANLFAGILLMPEVSLRRMYSKFNEESKGNELDTFIKLVAYYQVPYMAVLIRCFELNLTGSKTVSEELLVVTREDVEQKLQELWLDDSILKASNKDDYNQIEAKVKCFGEEFIVDSFMNERTLNKVLENMKVLYAKIKGE